jgi:hypothetical protein
VAWEPCLSTSEALFGCSSDCKGRSRVAKTLPSVFVKMRPSLSEKGNAFLHQFCELIKVSLL